MGDSVEELIRYLRGHKPEDIALDLLASILRDSAIIAVVTSFLWLLAWIAAGKTSIRMVRYSVATAKSVHSQLLEVRIVLIAFGVMAAVVVLFLQVLWFDFSSAVGNWWSWTWMSAAYSIGALLAILRMHIAAFERKTAYALPVLLALPVLISAIPAAVDAAPPVVDALMKWPERQAFDLDSAAGAVALQVAVVVAYAAMTFLVARSPGWLVSYWSRHLSVSLPSGWHRVHLAFNIVMVVAVVVIGQQMLVDGFPRYAVDYIKDLYESNKENLDF